MDQRQSNPTHFSTRPRPNSPLQPDGWVEDGVTVDERLIFRKVFFGSEEGLQVWTWLMMNLGFFKPVHEEKTAILRNFALELQTVLGLTHQDQLEMMIRYQKEIAHGDIIDPKKREKIRREMDGRSAQT